MSENGYVFVAIAIMSSVTVLLRFLPFWIFQKHTPKTILYLGQVLPYAIMSMLVVYCLRHVNLFEGNHGIPEAISLLLVIVIHKWKHNTLLSIIGGTFVYMLLIQQIF